MTVFNERYLELQVEGKCGYRQNNGRLCVNNILEYVQLDLDHPEGPANRLGACGTHIADLARDVKRMQEREQKFNLERYMEFEDRRIVQALNRAGVHVEISGPRYSRILQIKNPGEIVAKLADLGVLHEFDLRGLCQEGTHVRECGPGSDDEHCGCGCKLQNTGYYRYERGPRDDCWYVPPPNSICPLCDDDINLETGEHVHPSKYTYNRCTWRPPMEVEQGAEREDDDETPFLFDGSQAET